MLRPQHVPSRRERHSCVRGVLPRGDQARGQLIARLDVRADAAFNVVAELPGTVVTAVVTEDGAKRAVSSPAKEAACRHVGREFSVGAVAAAIAVDRVWAREYMSDTALDRIAHDMRIYL